VRASSTAAWVIGVAVYADRDTKVMLGAPSKRSCLETLMNRETVVLAVVLFVLCSVVALLGASGSVTMVTTSLRTCDPVLPQEGLLVHASRDDPEATYNWYGMGRWAQRWCSRS